MERKEPDLDFVRDYDGIEFYKNDDYLEIKTYNADSDTCIIILDPNEVKSLIGFLDVNFGIK